MYEFYMDGVRLPVTPSALTIKISNQNKTINLINEGQVNVLKTPGLSKISFSALLPNREYPFACYPNVRVLGYPHRRQRRGADERTADDGFSRKL